MKTQANPSVSIALWDRPLPRFPTPTEMLYGGAGSKAPESVSERAWALCIHAWELRQRQSARSLQIATNLLGPLGEEPVERPEQLRARAELTCAEIHWLRAERGLGIEGARRALELFESLGDFIGISDASWVLSAIWLDKGVSGERDTWMQRSLLAAGSANDPLREELALAATACFESSDGRGSHEKWERWVRGREHESHPSVMALSCLWRVLIAQRKGALSEALEMGARLREHALSAGMLRRAILADASSGALLLDHYDNDGAQECFQKSLLLAREAGWPQTLAMSLIQNAQVSLRLGKVKIASALAKEALDISRGEGMKNCYLQALRMMVSSQLAMGRPNLALSTCQLYKERAEAFGEEPEKFQAQLGLVRSLMELRDWDRAEKHTELLMQQANRPEASVERLDALRALCELSFHQSLGAVEANRLALEGAALAERLKRPDALFTFHDLRSQAQAALGSYQDAYEAAREAIKAREQQLRFERERLALALAARRNLMRVELELDSAVASQLQGVPIAAPSPVEGESMAATQAEVAQALPAPLVPGAFPPFALGEELA